MSYLELRPLSLGEILDRTFMLYRGHFLLFVALAAIPRLPALAIGLLQSTFLTQSMGAATTIGLGFIAVLLVIAGYLVSQGSAVVAVSTLYLNREISIAEALKRAVDEIGPLLGALILNGLAIFAGLIFLIIPGIYFMCRLLVVVPAVMIERKGPGESLSRSIALTKGFAGRAFLILLLYCTLALALGLLVAPLALGMAAAAENPALMRVWSAAYVTVNAILQAVLTPILLIATSIYYYDLRVRKEAFDLHVMMDPDGANIPRSNLRSVVPDAYL